jgi:hypothetical protein
MLLCVYLNRGKGSINIRIDSLRGAVREIVVVVVVVAVVKLDVYCASKEK